MPIRFPAPVLRQAFRLACYIAHGNIDLARQIYTTARERAQVRIDQQRHRRSARESARGQNPEGQPLGQYMWDIPDDTNLQIAICETAEQMTQQGDLVYPPGDLLPYIMHLVWRSMTMNSRYVAMAIGCRLYRYTPRQIESLAPDLIHMPWKLRDWIDEGINACFPGLLLHSTHDPTPAERTWLDEILSQLAPWNPSCMDIQTQTPLAALFGQTHPSLEGKRVHVLICPICGGVARLICEYNASLRRTRGELVGLVGQYGPQVDELLYQLLREFAPEHELPKAVNMLRIPD